MIRCIRSLIKPAAVIIYFVLLFPIMWESKQQMKEDVRHIVNWWMG